MFQIPPNENTAFILFAFHFLQNVELEATVFSFLKQSLVFSYPLFTIGKIPIRLAIYKRIDSIKELKLKDLVVNSEGR